MPTPKLPPGEELAQENEQAKPALVNEKNPAAQQLATENQKLQAKLKELESKLGQIQNQAKLIESLREENAKQKLTIDSLSDDAGLKSERNERRFQLFAYLLSGAAANHLYGKDIDKVKLENAIRHFAGVAAVAEAHAIQRGF